MELDLTIEQLLEQWGAWALNGLGLTLCSPGEDAIIITISDDIALEVDRAIASLKHRYPDAKTVLELSYRNGGMSCRQIAKRVKLGETKVRQIRLTCVSWLDGHLNAKGFILEHERESAA